MENGAPKIRTDSANFRQLLEKQTPLTEYEQYKFLLSAQRNRDNLNSVDLAQIAAKIPRCQALLEPQKRLEELNQILSIREADQLFTAIRAVETPPRTLQPEDSIYEEIGSGSWLSRFLNYARAGNAPLGYHFWCGLALLGAICQRRVFFSGGVAIFMNMYVVLGGHRACGKGQAIGPMLSVGETINELLLQEIDEAYTDDRRLLILPEDSTIESLISQLANRFYDVTKLPDGRTKVWSDKTPMDAVGLLPMDEMATFFGKEAFNASRRGPIMNTVKEGNKYSKRTKRDEEEILHHCGLSSVMCAAPDFMMNTMDTDLLGGGFMDRCNWIYREPDWALQKAQSVMNAQPKDPIVARDLAHWAIDNVLNLTDKEPMFVSDEARMELSKFHQKLVSKERVGYEKYGHDSEYKSANRQMWSMLQLTSLLALAEDPTLPLQADLRHAQLAIEILQREEDSMQKFLAHSKRNKFAIVETHMVEFVRENLGRVTKAMFNKKFNAIHGSEVTNKLVKSLFDQDRLRATKRSGERTTFYHLPDFEIKEFRDAELEALGES